MKKYAVKRLARSFVKALQELGHPVPHSVLLHALAKLKGDRNWHVLCAKEDRPSALTSDDLSYVHELVAAEDAMDGESKHLKEDPPQGILMRLAGVAPSSALARSQGRFQEVPVIRIGDKPLPHSTLQTLEAKGSVRAIVEVPFGKILDNDFEWFLDELSERLTGISGPALVNFAYAPVVIDNPTQDALAIEVVGDLDWSTALSDESSASDASSEPAYYRCGICECFHPADWNGDCREDAARFSADVLDGKHGAHGWREVPMPGTEEPAAVMAEMRTDDGEASATFDATAFFREASLQELERLASDDFGPGEAADRVADWAVTRNPEVARVFTYLRAKQDVSAESCGFEVYLDEDEARAWYEYRRKGLSNRPSQE